MATVVTLSFRPTNISDFCPGISLVLTMIVKGERAGCALMGAAASGWSGARRATASPEPQVIMIIREGL